MYDTVQTLGATRIQHGEFNDRIYVMRLDPADVPAVIPRLEDLAARQGYGKVIVKAPASCVQAFADNGYTEEARIPGFFDGREGVHFMVRYHDRKRQVERKPRTVEKNLALALAKQAAGERPRRPQWGNAVVSRAAEADVAAMAEVYRLVFPSYPFPIHDPAYLRKCMRADVDFFKVERGGRIVALSSAEMAPADGNAEMTDFATLPELRGQGAAQGLLSAMETAMAERKMPTVFTIARAYSTGMNVTFAKSGYAFGGTLTGNTNIGGAIESMNVWYKHLA